MRRNKGGAGVVVLVTQAGGVVVISNWHGHAGVRLCLCRAGAEMSTSHHGIDHAHGVVVFAVLAQNWHRHRGLAIVFHWCASTRSCCEREWGDRRQRKERWGSRSPR